MNSKSACSSGDNCLDGGMVFGFDSEPGVDVLGTSLGASLDVFEFQSQPIVM